MKVLLSIKPAYAEKIFKGEKKYEYRRSIFKKDGVDTIVVYVTKPVGKVIGEFKIDNIIKGNPKDIWKETKKYSGIKKKDYMEYFKERKNGFAICIKNVEVYENPLNLIDLTPPIKSAPQSFRYIKEM
ncbi:Predicted transcriptional regulator, contains an HTH and PUA-like domains [Clostridium sp. DSM 8431]|uniref:ASCH domain-containing protein n=1 Tax=Clostridium sp. DSM 8431 TaxID=1761781 RepID=UPI0008EAD74D|nr:ASCH domain-containing protein [Clostridium sp. DSM 8431]SFU78374.1 Predicted transcriptional regulator, contains an HTH and PUA-like domains [Clostridium sp. DSM 8431]